MIIPFKEAQNFTNEVIWRYMDFPKFISFLETSSLFFAKLSSFEDYYEGENNAIRNGDDKNILSVFEPLIKSSADGKEEVNVSGIRNSFKRHSDTAKKCMGVSCWRMSEDESHAMWKIFLSANEGIAIKTSFNKIKSAIENANRFNNRIFFMGKIEYINYDNETYPFDNLLNYLFYKNIYFSHEQEFRILAYDVNELDGDIHNSDNMIPLKTHGIKVAMDYKEIIEEIIIGPYAANWFHKLVLDVTRNRYGLKVPVKKSVVKLKGC